MKLLGIHTDHVWYRVTKKAKNAESDPVPEDSLENCVLLSTCVEKIDEVNPMQSVEKAAELILKRLQTLGAKKVMVFPYAHLSSELGCPGISLWILKTLKTELEKAGVETKRAAFGWYKEFEIKSKGHPMADFSLTVCPFTDGNCQKNCCAAEMRSKEQTAEQTDVILI